MPLRSDDMLGKKGFTKRPLYSYRPGSNYAIVVVAQRPDAKICLSRLLLLDIWHARGPCMAVIPTSALFCLHTVSLVPVCSHVFTPVALGRHINHC